MFMIGEKHVSSSSGSEATPSGPRLIEVNKAIKRVRVRQLASSDKNMRAAYQTVIDVLTATPIADVKETEEYISLRGAFIDFVCSGSPNLALYCHNRCEECVDGRGWCNSNSDKCRGFNPDGKGE